MTTPTGVLTIQRFVATPNPVDPGSVVLLNWEVSGADAVEIAPGVGVVAAQGSRVVIPSRTTSYSLKATSGTQTASSTLQVVVAGTPLPSPTPSPSPGASPSPSPSPEPSPSPSPSPSPDASPSPSPSPSPEPSPSPSPDVVSCGVQATFPGHCDLRVAYPDSLPASECIELTDVRTSADCPVNFAVPLSLSFQVTADAKSGFTWRRASSNQDVVTPSSGSIDATGETNVTVSDLVLGPNVKIEIVRGGKTVLTFVLGH